MTNVNILSTAVYLTDTKETRSTKSFATFSSKERSELSNLYEENLQNLKTKWQTETVTLPSVGYYNNNLFNELENGGENGDSQIIEDYNVGDNRNNIAAEECITVSCSNNS